MSFKKIIFNYTPPPTLSTPVGTVIPPTPNVAAETLLGEAYQTSNAGQLVQTMQNLKATAGYLSSAISSLSSGIGVTVDTAVDTDLTIALSRLYNSSSAIPAISLTMYQNLFRQSRISRALICIWILTLHYKYPLYREQILCLLPPPSSRPWQQVVHMLPLSPSYSIRWPVIA